MLNTNKTQCILFHKKTKTNLDILINNTHLQMSNSINLLGITFDEHITFGEHIGKVRCQVSRALGALKRSKNILPIKFRKLIYNALILPHLSYGIELWGTANKSILKPLSKLQKKAIRFIGNLRYNTPTSRFFKNYNIVKLDDLHQLQCISLLYKVFNNLVPPNILNLFQKQQIGARLTRQSALNFKVQRRGNRLYNKKISVFGPYLWNSTEVAIRQAATFPTFKKKIKSKLISTY